MQYTSSDSYADLDSQHGLFVPFAAVRIGRMAMRTFAGCIIPRRDGMHI